jgi:hypothetical protein
MNGGPAKANFTNRHGFSKQKSEILDEPLLRNGVGGLSASNAKKRALMRSKQHDSNEHAHRGGVKDPKHDGRMKENREAPRTKGATPGSEARAHEHGREPVGQSHEGGGRRDGDHSEAHAHSGSSHERSDRSEEADPKRREYQGSDGETHHHTRTYMEQHGGKK